jgi:hypothetical protein
LLSVLPWESGLELMSASAFWLALEWQELLQF